MPRLADLFGWATAAERGLGLPEGSAIEAHKRQANEESTLSINDPLAQKLIELCGKGWKGTAADLAAQTKLGLKPRQIGGQVRELAPDLRRQGFRIENRKSNGIRIIELSKA